MNAHNIRTQLHDYVDNGDEKLLKLMYAIAKEYNAADEFSFTKEDIALFEQRRASRLSGESKVYNWEDAKAIITGKKSA